MKKLMVFLLAAAFIALPLNPTYGKGGGKAGGGKPGIAKKKYFKGKISKAAWQKKWAAKAQKKRDGCENKLTAKKVDRR